VYPDSEGLAEREACKEWNNCNNKCISNLLRPMVDIGHFRDYIRIWKIMVENDGQPNFFRPNIFSANKYFFSQKCFFRPKSIFPRKWFLGQKIFFPPISIFSPKMFSSAQKYFSPKMISWAKNIFFLINNFSANKYFFAQKWFFRLKMIFSSTNDFFV